MSKKCEMLSKEFQNQKLVWIMKLHFQSVFAAAKYTDKFACQDEIERSIVTSL